MLGLPIQSNEGLRVGRVNKYNLTTVPDSYHVIIE